jgi:hypothetical protein
MPMNEVGDLSGGNHSRAGPDKAREIPEQF